MGEFRMPSLGADMEVGTLLEWRVGPGDVVHRGDVVAVVDTEKSTIEVEIFEDGVVEVLLVQEGEEVPVGTPLARIAATAPAPPEPFPVPEPSPVPEPGPPPEPFPAPEPPPVPEPGPPPEPFPVPEPPPVPSLGAPPVVTSPVVRHLAEQLHVDVAAVVPTGAGGHVTRADVERAAAALAPRSPGTSGSAAVSTSRNRQKRENGRVVASPYARRLAAERGVDLASLRGSGPGGAIVAADLEAHPAPPTPATRPGADRQLALRRAIAATMAKSKREIPHYYLRTTVDLSRSLEWLRAANETRAVADRLLPAVMLLKATALAARDVPGLNGFWVDEAYRPADHVHLGVAISLRGGGVVAPAIHDTDTAPLDELMAALRDLVSRARAGTLRASEMADPTITVTNLGDQGVEEVYGVIHPPQVAIVGFGAVVERPWAIGGLLGVRPVVTVTLAADHRACDGHLGSRFLQAIDRRLQQPEGL